MYRYLWIACLALLVGSAGALQLPGTRQAAFALAGYQIAAPRNGLGDLLAGVFTDSNMRLELAGSGGRYQGKIQFKGSTYPVTAQSADGESLRGSFTSGAHRFDFTANLEGNTLTFVTGGTTYQLQRQAAAGGGFMGGGRKASTAGEEGTPAFPAGGTGPSPRPLPGGQTVNDPSQGVRFSVPPGWKYAKQQAVYVIGHDTIPGTILVMPHQANSLQELAQAASEPLYQADDGQLMVTSQAATLASNMLAAEYGGMLQGRNVRGRIVGVVSPHGGGFLVMAGTNAESYGPQYAQWAEGIARSMTFAKPQAPPEAAMWKQKLAGMRVAYFKSGGSTDLSGSYSWSDKRNIDLCSNGMFQSEGGFEGSLGTAGGSAIMQPGTESNSGQWSIVGQAGQPALQLRHATGKVETFVLTTDGSKTYLDGVRWYVIENPTCQ